MMVSIRTFYFLAAAAIKVIKSYNSYLLFHRSDMANRSVERLTETLKALILAVVSKYLIAAPSKASSIVI